jgi:type I restriction enzyme S subunit
VPASFYEATLGRFGVGDGDVIFSRKGKVGYARLHPVNQQLAMTHTLCVLKPDRSKIDSRYLLHFTRSPMFLEELTGTMNPNVGVPTLGLGVIRDATIPLPPVPEQHHIAAELDTLQAEVDALKCLQAESAAELDVLLPSILDRAFCGEL